MSAAPRFDGSIPQFYQRHLGSVFFEPYAADLTSRLPIRKGMRVLELACGTGVVTRRLASILPPDARITATDLNETMMDEARQRRGGADSRIEWRQADATALPFPDNSFDAVLCQFGVMFFPDKPAGAREALRVLKPGGAYLFNVWDDLSANDFSRITDEVLQRLFPEAPPQFLKAPFSYDDPDEIRRLLGGFIQVSVARVELPSESPSAEDIANGLVRGTPLANDLTQRNRPVDEIVRAVAAAIAAKCGQRPARGRMRALVAEARKPA